MKGAPEFVVEINAADTINLQALKGIGSGFANRIVGYRQLLGGYNSKDQLLEVYGMDSLRYLGFEAHISIDTSLLVKIPINGCTVKDLLRHPYIDYSLASTLVRERNKNGLFRDLEDLRRRLKIPEPIFLRLTPYLSTSER